ncbi:hypothetical protein [uncultured Amnibacterium sp.]|uniref:hypothetical protein n=1 Tax=uncultured Amnibacterium sp. TaxID=1631851 RepID=UPI0035CBE26C
MSTPKTLENSESRFAAVLGHAARLPGVRIHRDAYLRKALKPHCSAEQIANAVADSPAAAGISLKVLDKAAEASIALETTKVAALAAAAGLPGGFAMIGTVPADLAQSVAHMLRISQKLAYLYSWPELFGDAEDEPDDATQNVLVLFIGVMFGAGAAIEGVNKVAVLVGEQVALQLPKRALTHGVIYPVVKKVMGYLGVKLTKDTFAKGVAKFVPIAGAVLSGGLTLATFLPMAKRLKKHLAELEMARPVAAAPTGDPIDDSTDSILDDEPSDREPVGV